MQWISSAWGLESIPGVWRIENAIGNLSTVRIERVARAEGGDLFFVRVGIFCLGKGGSYIHQPAESSRDEKFATKHFSEQCGFASLRGAQIAAEIKTRNMGKL